MADSVAKQFEIVVTSEIAKKISKATIRRAANAAGKAAIDAIQDRTKAGISRTGRKLPPLSDKDITLGKDFVIESYKSRKGRSDPALYKGRGKTTTWKSTGQPQHGRLTGQFFTAMGYRIGKTDIKKGRIQLDIILVLKGSQEKKVRWLESTRGATKLFGLRKKKKSYTKKARKIWGLSSSGKWKKIEQDRIRDAFIKSFVKNAEVKVTT